MTHWSDPTQIAYHARIFTEVLLVLIGFYGWEVLLGLSYDWKLVRKSVDSKKCLPTVVYILCKYGTLISLIGINITNSATGDIPCQGLYTSNQFWGDVAIGGASTLLMFRALAIWRDRAEIKWALLVLSLAQWVILLFNVTTIKSSRPPNGDACIVTDTSPVIMIMLYSYTMFLDFVVLVLTVVGLMHPSLKNTGAPLWDQIFGDAILYCAVAFTANTIATVFVVLRLNPVMEVMFAVPACVFSAIVACRSFRRLDQFSEKRDSSACAGVRVQPYRIPNISPLPVHADHHNNLNVVHTINVLSMSAAPSSTAATPVVLVDEVGTKVSVGQVDSVIVFASRGRVSVDEGSEEDSVKGCADV